MNKQVDETDLSITKQVLKDLPDVKGFSLDKRIKWEPKNDVTVKLSFPLFCLWLFFFGGKLEEA